MGNTMYEPQYEQKFFSQSEDIPRILEDDNLGRPITQEEMLQTLKGVQNDKAQAWMDSLQNFINSSCKVSKSICSTHI